MNDQPKLVVRLIIGDEAVRTLERIVMGLTLNLQRRLHRFAAERGRIGVLGLRTHSAASLDFQLST